MSDSLIIRLLDADATEVSWRLTDDDEAPTGTGTLADAARHAEGRSVRVLVPTSEILLTQVEVPPTNRQRLLQAIPYALENDLADELDQLHFAIDTREEGQGTQVAVISRARLNLWLEKFREQNLQPVGMYPDMLCLPLTPGNWTVYLDDERVLVRTGVNTGFAADPVNFAELLHLSINSGDLPVPERLDIIQAPYLSSAPYFDLALSRLQCETRQLEFDGDLMRLLTSNFDQRRILNLLQGEFRQIDQNAIQWRHWVPAAVMLGLFLILTLAASGLEFYRLEAENRQLDKRIKQVFHQTFPEVQRIVDPRIQMEQKLSTLRNSLAKGGTSFFELFSIPAEAIRQFRNASLKSFSFRDGTLNLQLTIGELQSLESLKKRIESANLKVVIQSANARNNSVDAHIRITREES